MKIAAIEAETGEQEAKSKIKTIHIDTSIQIERCKAKRKAKIINSTLRHFPFTSTSSYAKYEFKSAWLRDLGYLYGVTQKAEVNRIEELYGHINDKLGAHPASRNRLSRCLQGIESFLSKVPGSISYEASFVRLQSQIRYAILGAYTWWNRSTTHEYSGTGCVRAFEEPKQYAGAKIDVSIPQCRRNRINCAMHKFFLENKPLFIAIGAEIGKLGGDASKELQEAKKVIRDTERNPEYLCDDRVCRKLGDVLIAIDGLNMQCFAANNDKEWVLLAKVLGKELINPVREAKLANQT